MFIQQERQDRTQATPRGLTANHSRAVTRGLNSNHSRAVTAAGRS